MANLPIAAVLGGGTVTFVERVDKADPGCSPIESFAQDNSRTTRTYDVAYTDRVKTIKSILGGQSTSGDGGVEIKRYAPLNDPDWFATSWGPANQGDGLPFLFASEISKIEGIGKPAGGNFKNSAGDLAAATYLTARISVTFSMPTFVIFPGNTSSDESNWSRWVTRDFRVSGEYLSVPGGAGMKFVTGPHTLKPVRIVGVRPGKVIPKYDLRVTWQRVPQRAIGSIVVNAVLQSAGTLGAIDTTIGKVNQGVFNGFPAATVLLLGCSIKAYRWGSGNFYYDVEYLFNFNQNGFNKVPYLSAANTFGFVEISTDGLTHNDNNPLTGWHIFDNADFKKLFQAAA